MIKGIGCDIVEIARIKASVAKSPALAKRVLTPAELQQYQVHKQPERFLAKRFAAKEAIAKALGTGIGRGVSFQHIQISNNELGAPLASLTDGAFEQLQKMDASACLVSISDEVNYAMASAVIQ